MNLDPRIPIGMMLSMAGAVITAFGLATRDRPELYARSLGIDANLWWGAVVLIAGIVVLAMGRRGQAKIEQKKLGRR
ncbi:MAG TPA: hypothetical protein VKU93_10250 [Terracidiphilus sp.]|jgi:hypothetical protein|nr:hypothetical protein [Terracidiphilus sp.]